MKLMHLLREICSKMFMEHCAFPIIFVKGQKEQLNPYEKNYLIPQMALSVWQSILALLSIVSVA